MPPEGPKSCHQDAAQIPSRSRPGAPSGDVEKAWVTSHGSESKFRAAGRSDAPLLSRLNRRRPGSFHIIIEYKLFLLQPGAV